MIGIKGGLAWMIAFVRIEWNATISIYENLKRPFSDIVTSNSGTEECCRLLIDDVINHLKPLAGELLLFRDVPDTKREIDNGMSAYLRRLKIFKEMLLTISAVEELVTVDEMGPYTDELAEQEKALVDLVTGPAG